MRTLFRPSLTRWAEITNTTMGALKRLLIFSLISDIFRVLATDALGKTVWKEGAPRSAAGAPFVRTVTQQSQSR